MSKQSLIVQIMADASRYTRGLGQAASATGRFGASARAELSRLKSFATSLHGQLAGLGIGVGLAKMSKDTAVFERDDDWVIAYCPEIPGANGQGRTKDDARESLRQAIALILEDRREEGLRAVPADAERETVVLT